MNVVLARCAGLDVHKRSITACAIIDGLKSVAEFGATTRELLRLSDWLAEFEVTHVAMESAGVYWKPVYNLLEVAGFELLLVNARHMKAVPGRKTDIKDAEWIADLLRHGLLTASFVPKRPAGAPRTHPASPQTGRAAQPGRESNPTRAGGSEHQAR